MIPLKGEQKHVKIRGKSSRIRMHGFESKFCLVVLSRLAIYLTPLYLSFLVCKMGIEYYLY